MTEIFLIIIRTLLAPIGQFWEKVETYKATGEYGKMIASFLASLLLVVAMAIAIITLFLVLITYHFEIVLIVGAIAWVYWFAKKYFTKQEPMYAQATPINPNDTILYQNGKNGYASIRTIIFLCLRECAEEIGAKKPRTTGEIETNDKFIISNECVFYQFQCYKEDFRTQNSIEDMQEFANILQNTYDRLLRNGSFPQISLHTFIDNQGNIFPSVMSDRIDDLGATYLIQVVYVTQAYVNYVFGIQENLTAPPDTGYNPNDSRFL